VPNATQGERFAFRVDTGVNGALVVIADVCRERIHRAVPSRPDDRRPAHPELPPSGAVYEFL
jgi:hypothetical protein